MAAVCDAKSKSELRNFESLDDLPTDLAEYIAQLSEVFVKDVEDMNRLKLSVWLRHRINFQDMGMKWTRRELVVQEMIRIFKELNIEYRMLPMDVNIRNLPPELPQTFSASPRPPPSLLWPPPATPVPSPSSNSTSLLNTASSSSLGKHRNRGEF